MKKYSIVCAFLLLFQVAMPVNIVQEAQKGWLSSLVSGGYNLVGESLMAAMLSGLFYKAQEYGEQKKAAEGAIQELNTQLQDASLSEEKRAEIIKKIKQQEILRDKKATIAQRAAQVASWVMGSVFVGLNIYSIYYLVRYGDRNYHVDSAGFYHWRDPKTGNKVVGTKDQYDAHCKEVRRITEETLKKFLEKKPSS